MQKKEPPENVKFTIAEQDLVEVYQAEIAEILRFLGMDLDECLVTDESSIDDFSLCYPEDQCPTKDAESYHDALDQWDAWIQQSWPTWFPRVTLGRTHTDSLLVNLAAKIRESRNVQ